MDNSFYNSDIGVSPYWFVPFAQLSLNELDSAQEAIFKSIRYIDLIIFCGIIFLVCFAIIS